MHLVRFRTVADATPRVGVRTDDGLAPLPVGSAAELWRLPIDELRSLTESVTPQPIPPDVAWLPPVDGRTEVWAAGVTYLRSRDARVQESRQQSVYEQVYDAGRPELFYKAAAWRVVTDGEPVAIRTDSTDDVPEPELAVVFGAHGGILGYLVCNDMSSRSIEGENPLYLPQAKIYAGSCALSSGVRPAWEVDASDLAVTMVIRRGDVTAFEGATRTSQHAPDAPRVGRISVPGGALPRRRRAVHRYRRGSPTRRRGGCRGRGHHRDRGGGAPPQRGGVTARGLRRPRRRRPAAVLSRTPARAAVAVLTDHPRRLELRRPPGRPAAEEVVSR